MPHKAMGHTGNGMNDFRKLHIFMCYHMRKLKLLFLATFFMTTDSIGQISQPNELADKIIASFQTKDFVSYRKLLLTTADYKEFLNDYFKSNHIPESGQKEFADIERKFADSADIKFQMEFNRLLNKGVKLDIDWTQIKRAKFVFKEVKPVNSDKKSLSGHLNFIYKDTIYVIFGIEGIELSSGYKISNIRTILKGRVGQYIDPDLLDEQDL